VVSFPISFPIVRTPQQWVLGDVPSRRSWREFARRGKGEFAVDASQPGIAEPNRRRPLRWHLASFDSRFRALRLVVEAVPLFCDRDQWSDSRWGFDLSGDLGLIELRDLSRDIGVGYVCCEANTLSVANPMDKLLKLHLPSGISSDIGPNGAETAPRIVLRKLA
jgi:hypothetical protein